MAVYYNENDPKAAAWLGELIKAGLVAPGDVDERSIVDVHPNDLKGYAQCHFFAGIGIWSYSLRQAGWSDERSVWTGSCPCQPFSAAGKGEGFADERHLWPYWFHLIGVERPKLVLGEQVASPSGRAWLELVQADMEGLGSVVGAVEFPAASVGAPHQRQRNYWVALANTEGDRWRRRANNENRGWWEFAPGYVRAFGGMGNAQRIGAGRDAGAGTKPQGGAVLRNERDDTGPSGAAVRPGATNGFWRDADWLHCRDEKWRPVEPGSFPVADGIAARVPSLRGYGNGLVAPQAKIFIETVMELL